MQLGKTTELMKWVHPFKINGKCEKNTLEIINWYKFVISLKLFTNIWNPYWFAHLKKKQFTSFLFFCVSI
jgi:hypothetical protein